MQRGSIQKRSGSWYLLCRDWQWRDGKRARKLEWRKLAPVGPEYPTKASVRLLAEKSLAPINEQRATPESSMPVTAFIENVYLPFVKLERRASTYKNYSKDLYAKHVKSRLGKLRLKDFRTVHGQRLLRDIPGISHETLFRVKSFLSGTFKHAKREGYLDGLNPMQDVSVPGRPKRFNGPTYTLNEIDAIIGAMPKGIPRLVILTAALTGLRLSELRGLRWSDFDGETLHVTRSMWRTFVAEPKTAGSEADVPILPLLSDALKRHHDEHPFTTYIFEGERRGTPLNLANLARRVIIPKLKEQKLQWHGWHAFRRSLASTLYALGTPPKVIQSILRHSDIGTTLAFYVKTSDEESREALRQIEQNFWFSSV
jgi:integrase